jgi:hypothetical protein
MLASDTSISFIFSAISFRVIDPPVGKLATGTNLNLASRLIQRISCG